MCFVFKTFLVKKLGAEGIGYFQICLTFLGTLFCLTSSGISVIVSRKTASLKNCKSCYSFVSATIITTISLCTIISIVLLLLKKVLIVYFINEITLKTFFILLPTLFTTSLYSVIRGWFWGNKKYNVFSTTELLEEVVRILLAIIIFSLDLFPSPLYSIACAFCIADIISCIILTASYFIYGGKLCSPCGFKELLYTSTPITATRIIGSLMSACIAYLLPFLLMKNGFSQSEATASYGRISGMVLTLLYAPTTITNSISTVLVPEVSTLKTNKSNVSKYTDNALSASLIITGYFVSLFLCLGKEITTLFFNDVISGIYLSFSATVVIFISLNGITNSILNSYGLEKQSLLNFIISNGIFLAVMCLTVKRYNYYSYAIAQFIGSTVSFSINTFILARHKMTDFSFFKPFVFSSIGISISSIITSTIKHFLGQTSFIQILLLSIIIFSIYTIILLATNTVKIQTVLKFVPVKLSKTYRQKRKKLV